MCCDAVFSRFDDLRIGGMSDLDPQFLALFDDAVDALLLARVVAGHLGVGGPPAAIDAALQGSEDYQVAMKKVNRQLRVVRERLGDDELLLALEGAVIAALVASSDVGFRVAMVHWAVQAERR
jgi:hypothetical protein